MDADYLISLTHFKGHESTGFGGAIKNIGMGGGSRAGKMEQHSAGKPYVNKDSVWAAVCVREYVPTMPLPLTNAKHRSIMINVWAAADVLVSVRKMQ